MSVIFKARDVLIPADVTKLPLILDVPACTFVQCVSATADFLISLDDGANYMPFGQAREIFSRNGAGEPSPFNRVFLNWGPANLASQVSLVFGTGNYRDSRVTLAPAQEIRDEIPDALYVTDVALVGFPFPSADYVTASGETIIRNTHATADLRVSNALADYNAGKGIIVPAGDSLTLKFNGRLYLNGPAGMSVNVGSSYFL